MTTPILVNDLLQEVVTTFFQNQVGVNVWGWKVTSITGAPTMEALAVEVTNHTADANDYKAVLCNGASYRGVAWRRITPSPTVAFINIVGQGAGTAGAQPLPLNISGIITKRTAVSTRGGRGRAYIPFPAEADLDTDGSPTASYVTRLTTLASHLATSATWTFGGGAAITMVAHLVSRKFPGTSNPIVSTTPQKKFAVQHRRGQYGKQNVQPF